MNTYHPDTRTAVTAYILNAERTKLLMLYDERVDRWQPVTGWTYDNELPYETAQRAAKQLAGVEAAPLLPHEADAGWILEADESAVEPWWLHEEYDAQWLDRAEITESINVCRVTQRFARHHLEVLA